MIILIYCASLSQRTALKLIIIIIPTLFVAVTWCCCPLVAFLLDLHAAFWSTADFALLFCSQQLLSYWHQHYPPEQRVVWVDSFREAWFELCMALAMLLSLVSSFPETYIQLNQFTWTTGQNWSLILLLLFLLDTVGHVQQVSIFHPSGSHIPGTLVACDGWHIQMNSQDSDISLDRVWCMS